MKLEEAIVVLKPQIDPSILERFIKFIEYRAKNKLATSDGNTDYRNVFGHSLKLNNISDKVFFKHIQDIITKNYSFFKFKFPQIRTDKIEQIDILKYIEGGKYEIHHDHSYNCQRTLTCIINLNENYEGGDFIFYKQNGKDEMKRVKCEKGTMIFFPSNFLYPHKIDPITKGTRYSIVSWLL